jgi:hypothetical protein
VAEVTVGGLRCVLCALTVPRIGAWVADVDLDSDATPSGRVVLSIDGVERVGAVVRGAVASGSWRGRLVGGAGGLARVLDAVALRGSTLADVLADVLRASGETPSTTSSGLERVAPLWARIAGPASTAVADVARAAGVSWRVLADGSVRVGAETWAEQRPSGPVDVLEELPESGRLVLGGDVLGIDVGRTLVLPGRAPVRVEQLEIRATPRELRATVTAEGTTGLGPVVDAVIRRALRRVDYLALYPARVVSQSGQLLDLIPDDPRVPSISGVPMRHGLPGASVTVPIGTRVVLGFDAGDPARPVAALWEAGGTATQIAINGSSTKAARDGEAVNASAALSAWFTQVQLATGVAPPSGAIGAVSGGSDVVRIP